MRGSGTLLAHGVLPGPHAQSGHCKHQQPRQLLGHPTTATRPSTSAHSGPGTCPGLLRNVPHGGTVRYGARYPHVSVYVD